MTKEQFDAMALEVADAVIGVYRVPDQRSKDFARAILTEYFKRAEPDARLLSYTGKDPYPSGLAKQGHIIARSYTELTDGQYADTWGKVSELYRAPTWKDE